MLLASRDGRDQSVALQQELDLWVTRLDAAAARSYGLVAAAALGNGPHPRTRFADLLIAATAHTRGLDLYTRNIADFGGLEDLIRVVGV